MVFVAFGLLVGPQALSGIELSSSSAVVRTLAEGTLAFVLFCDASRIEAGRLRRGVGVPLRLLGIGLPLTIALGAVAAAAIFDVLSVWEAVILSIVLAPTDAALGQAVVSDERVPQPIRQGLNLESGLNDGICVPLLFAAVAVADIESEISDGRDAGNAAARGDRVRGARRGRGGPADRGDRDPGRTTRADRGDLAAGHPGGRRGARLRAGGWAARVRFHCCVRGRRGLPFAYRRAPARLTEFSEELGTVLNGVTFVLFGAVLLGPALTQLSWALVLYAVLSLTLVRMVSVAVAMLGFGRAPRRSPSSVGSARGGSRRSSSR